MNAHWRERRIALLDSETTGLDSVTDRILELAVVASERGRIVDRRAWLLDPGVPIPAEATAIHGVTDAMVRGKPTFADVAIEIVEAIGDAIPAAYNALFDRGFVAAEIARCGLLPPPCLAADVTWLDPYVWAREAQRYEKGKKRLGDRLTFMTNAARDMLRGGVNLRDVDAHALSCLYDGIERSVADAGERAVPVGVDDDLTALRRELNDTTGELNRIRVLFDAPGFDDETACGMSTLDVATCAVAALRRDAAELAELREAVVAVARAHDAPDARWTARGAMGAAVFAVAALGRRIASRPSQPTPVDATTTITLDAEALAALRTTSRRAQLPEALAYFRSMSEAERAEHVAAASLVIAKGRGA